MNAIKYIGMDVHLATISIAVRDGKVRGLDRSNRRLQAQEFAPAGGGLRGAEGFRFSSSRPNCGMIRRVMLFIPFLEVTS